MGNDKNIIPRDPRDQLFFVFLCTGIPFAIFWLGAVVLPNYHQEFNDIVLYHILLTLFIVYNIFHNILLVIKTDASGRSSVLPSILKPNWKYCSICQVNGPPRSYHCHYCNECILKRDHHCKFTGCCIGYHNHRYFLTGVSYIWIGALYGAWYNWEYTFNTIDLSGLYFFLTLLAPHFSWLFGGVTIWGSIVATLHTLGLTTLTCVTYILILQQTAIFNGQTQYEKKHGIKDYDLSLSQNIEDVLGTRWTLVWLSPMILSPLKGDGIKFLKRSEFEPPKDL
ncbi:unnamed protein product, partial [Meganyctiphanes norvegica]